ncbi:MAG: hypothetical protein U9O98_02260 [Asgard group archaeon]|nr:hypothetical protein [Asgard group archaeon]
MKYNCQNCGQELEKKVIICPTCYAFQSNEYTRKELFAFLEKYYPLSITEKKEYTSTKFPLPKRNHTKWVLIGLGTFWFGYIYYLLLTLQDLNYHWYYPHEQDEKTTKIDLFTVIIITISTLFLGIPFLQYVRYKKLRTHLQHAPHSSKYYIPQEGKRIFWLYLLDNVLFSGSITMLFFGLSSIIASRYFEFSSTFLIILFFLGTFILFVLAIWLLVQLIIFDAKWQKTLNKHFNNHLKNINKIQNYK